MVNDEKSPDLAKGDGKGYEEYFKRINKDKSSEQDKNVLYNYFSDVIDTAKEDKE